MPTDQQYGPPAPPGYGQGPLDRAFQPLDVSRFQQQPSQAAQVLQRNPGRDQFQATAAREGARRRKAAEDSKYGVPGSYEEAVARAKKLSGMGDGFDSLFHSALWIRGQVPVDDSEGGDGSNIVYAAASPQMKAVEPGQVKVSPEAMREVARLMRTPEGRKQLQQQVDDFKAQREQHYAATPKQEITSSPEGTAEGDTIEYENARRSNLDRSATGRATLAFEDATKNLSGGNPLLQIPLDIATQPIRAVNDLISMFEPDAWAYQQPGDRLGAAVNAAFGLLQGGAAAKAVKEGLSGATVLREALGLPGVEGLKNPLAGAAQTFMGLGDAAAATPKLIKAMTQRGVPAAEAEVAAKHITETLAQATPEEVEKALYHGTGAMDAIKSEGFRHGFSGNGNDQYGPGFYFTNDKASAGGYASDALAAGGKSPGIIHADLDVKNPIIIDGTSGDNALTHFPELTKSQTKQLVDDAIKLNPDSMYDWGDVGYEGEAAIKKKMVDAYSGAPITAIYDLFGKDHIEDGLRTYSRLSGHDGVKITFKDGVEHTVAWFPEQVRPKAYGAFPNEKATQEANAVREVAQGQGLQNEGELAQGQKAGQEADAVLPQEEGQVGTKYAASNAASNDLRASAGLDPLEPSLQSAVTREQAAATYDGQAVLSRARQIVEDNRAGVRPPVPTQEEVLHMDMAAAEAGRRMNQAKQALADAIDSGADPTEARRLYDMAREDVDTLTLASKAQGTEQSRAFSARNSAYFEDLTPAGVYRDFTVAKGAKLTDAEARQAEEMGRRLQKAESDIELAKARAETARAQERIRELEQQARVAGRRGGRASGPRTAEQITAQRQAAVERIKARFADAAANRPMADPFGAQAAGMGAKLLADIAPDVMEVVRLYAEEGIIKLSEVVARVRHHVGEDVLSEGDVQRIIAGDYEHPPVTRSEAAKQVAQWRKELKTAGVGQETALRKSIAEYEAKIKSGEFPARAPKPAIPDDLQKLYVRKEALKAEAASMRSKIQSAEAAKNQPLIAKIGHEAFNVPRTLVASTDLSAGLNQGMFAAYTHPDLWAKSNVAGLYALKNEENFYKVIGEVRANEHYDDAIAGGLKIASDAPHFDPGGDMMLSKMLSASGEVDTRLGKIGLNPIAASERAYVATITKLRMDLFSNMVKQAEKPALFGLVKPQKLTLQDYKDIADWVNVATGAGTNGIARGLQHVNNHVPVIFSPGYMVSRWQLAYGGPGRLIKAIKNNPRVALEIAKDYSKFAGAAGGLLYAAKMSGADVELDPRSTAFGKVKVGDTTIDPFAGILAPYRVMTQVAVGSKQKNGGIMPPNAAATLGYYGTGKASPLPRAALNLSSGLAGKDVFGKSYDPRTAEGLANTGVSMLPIQVQSQMDLAEDKSLNEAQKDALRILVLLGVNTQTDTPKESSRSRSSSRTSSRGRASLR